MNNRDRLQKGFELLSEGLEGPVDDVMTAVFGTRNWDTRWAKLDSERFNTPLRKINKADPAVQLRAITEFGREFNHRIARHQQAYASELRNTRNEWAHLETFDSERTSRALNTIELLLEAVDAFDSAADTKELRLGLQGRVSDERERTIAKRKLVGPNITDGMQPWREIIKPREEVTKGQYQASEFAINLADIAITKEACTPGNPYGDPVEFFNRTYLTEGLRDLLTRAVKRITGDNSGSPIVNLQTNFGGGKTHSLLALYHLFGERSVLDFSSDIQDLVSHLRPGEPWEPGSVNRATIVGTFLNTAKPSVKPDGTKINTIWGEIAWQLGGADGYAYVAENDRTSTPPADALQKLLKAYSPCLILVDEWVAYARQLVGRDDLTAGTFANQFTFAQTLTEAVAGTENCMLVVSIPASENTNEGSSLEVGGQNGQEALEKLQHVIGRQADQWRPSTRDESFEIVRKRLFEEPTVEQHAQIGVIAKKFINMYRGSAQSFPSNTTTSEYENRIRGSYPLHPELLDRLYEDWSTLETFQRTRGVLRLVSTIIHELWVSNDQSPLILPGHIPFESEALLSQISQFVQESWRPIIEADVSGSQSTAAMIDSDHSALGQRHLAQRVARTVFLGSVPRIRQKNKTLSSREVWLGTAMPADTLGNFNFALEQLTDRSTYFFKENTGYRFGVHPSIAKTARDYRDQLHEDPELILEEIVSRLRDEAFDKKRGIFPRVCPAPETSADIADLPEVTLVIVHPKFSMRRSDAKNSTVGEWVRKAIDYRGTAQRLNRNMLVFLAPDTGNLAALTETVCTFMAWKRVLNEKDSLNLDQMQLEQVRRSIKEADRSIDQRIQDTYCWCVYPTQDDPKSNYELATVQVTDTSGQSLAERTGSKLSQDGMLVADLNPNMVKMTLINPVRSAFVDGALSVKTMWDFITKYIFMARLVNRAVLERALADSISAVIQPDERFALAARRGEDDGMLQGLLIPDDALPASASIAITDETLIVDWDVANEARRVQQKFASEEGESGNNTPAVETGDQPKASPAATGNGSTAPAEHAKTRYFASIEMSDDSFSSFAANLNSRVLDPLRQTGASIKISIDLQATLPEGFDEHFMNVFENSAEQLRLDSSGFEEE
ncbi:DUF499 domain-containing protein [Gleimia hominis]|uniref:DUF499 domain-containing protein n=1 Tax=Gleimia hominis TaxID=595468 RepID=A0ABU3I8X9_9ACTO|nr:DUF499 domain-containing protein [Gleimia hominis]MDT3766832.1 DUF499 domain-containing protein [Gleimia hominis]